MANFPDVPDVAGVPAIPRDPNAVVEDIVNLVADTLGLFGAGSSPVWGLYLDGEVAIAADSVIAFGFKKGFSISTYPLEEGSFESYNKVQRPFTGRIRMSTGGSVSDRIAFLQDIDEAVSSLNLYDIVTPEITCESVNPIDYDYNRAAIHGVGMLTVDIVCEQVRQTASSAFTSSQQNAGTSSNSSSGTSDFIGTASPSGTVQTSSVADISNPTLPSSRSFVNGGTVQPQQVSAGSFDITAVVQP